MIDEFPHGWILGIVLFGGAYAMHLMTKTANLTKLLHKDMDSKRHWEWK